MHSSCLSGRRVPCVCVSMWTQCGMRTPGHVRRLVGGNLWISRPASRLMRELVSYKMRAEEDESRIWRSYTDRSDRLEQMHTFRCIQIRLRRSRFWLGERSPFRSVLLKNPLPHYLRSVRRSLSAGQFQTLINYDHIQRFDRPIPVIRIFVSFLSSTSF